jgi:hypothetical protein
MTNPDVLTAATNAALREAVGRYCAEIAIPCFMPVDGFAEAHIGEVPRGTMTLVTGREERLAIKVHGGDHETRAFVNVDLEAQGEEVASFVAPGFYDERGEWDPDNGKFGRKVVRPLTEAEGRELTMDLYSIIKKIPASSRRK